MMSGPIARHHRQDFAKIQLGIVIELLKLLLIGNRSTPKVSFQFDRDLYRHY